MEKTTLGLIAALGAAAGATAANASVPNTQAILNPTSVAELLDPVANPVATLDALQDRQLEAVEPADAQVAQLVEVQYHHHHHYYHHHHHHFFRRFYHHHHHHHHFFRHHHHYGY